MLRAATERLLPRSRNRWGWLLALALLAAAPAPAADAELASFELEQSEDGLLLGYAVNFELSRPVEEALAKAVPLHFVAEAEVFRERWYWRDKRVARATRVWRIVYQPLTSLWRVTFGDLSQTYSSRAEALAAVRRAVAWKVAEPGQLEEGERHYVEFSFLLDTTQLPRPMQIGIGGEASWALSAERSVPLN
jgi:Domain of unknown function (DUF4390)